MTNRDAPKAAFVVFISWWLILSGFPFFGLIKNGATDGLWGRLIWNFGLFVSIGIFGALLFIRLSREVRLAMLTGQSVRGLYGTIGDLPLLDGPEKTPDSESISVNTAHDVKWNVYEAWDERYGAEYPSFKLVIDELMRVYLHSPNLPATHVKGGHGGRTLFEHSLLVAGVMWELAQDWKYDGLRNASGQIVVPLKTADYHFQVDDPLIYLIGLAHDIGKIDSYIYDATGAIVDCKHQHDQIGARMLARLASIWGLPDADRRILLHVVGHYHHPQRLPLDVDGTAIDDRMIALQELLIKADNVASQLEINPEAQTCSKQSDTKDVPTSTVDRPVVEPTKESSPSVQDDKDNVAAATTNSVASDNKKSKQVAAQPVKPAAIPVLAVASVKPIEDVRNKDPLIYRAFIELVSQVNRINGEKDQESLGQKYGDLIVLHEATLLKAMCKTLNRDAHRIPGRRFDVIEELMLALDEKNILFKEFDGIRYSPQEAYFDVEFFKSGKGKKSGEKLAAWRHAIIIVPGEVLPGLSRMANYDAAMEIIGQCCDSPPRSRPKKSIDVSDGGTSSLDEARAKLIAEINKQQVLREQKKLAKKRTGQLQEASDSVLVNPKNVDRQPKWSVLEEVREQAIEYGRAPSCRDGKEWMCKQMLLEVFPVDMHKMVSDLWQYPPAGCEVRRTGQYDLLGFVANEQHDTTLDSTDKNVGNREVGGGAAQSESSGEDACAPQEYVSDEGRRLHASDDVNECDPTELLIERIKHGIQEGVRYVERGEYKWVVATDLVAMLDKAERLSVEKMLIQLVGMEHDSVHVKQVGGALLVGIKNLKKGFE